MQRSDDKQRIRIRGESCDLRVTGNPRNAYRQSLIELQGIDRALVFIGSKQYTEQGLEQFVRCFEIQNLSPLAVLGIAFHSHRPHSAEVELVLWDGPFLISCRTEIVQSIEENYVVIDEGLLHKIINFVGVQLSKLDTLLR